MKHYTELRATNVNNEKKTKTSPIRETTDVLGNPDRNE